ncbi:hypothetical protein ACFVAV_17000 [Nocardia sp. NPDC057663]
MIDDDAPVTLTRCRRWTLESLAAVAPARNQSTTVYEFANPAPTELDRAI